MSQAFMHGKSVRYACLPHRFAAPALRVMILPAVAISALVFSFLSAQAQSGAERRDPLQIYRDAGASPEQEAKIRQAAQEYEKEGKVRVERLRNLTRQLKELSYQPDMDEQKTLAMQDEINGLQNALNTDRIKLALKIRSLLSTEQRVKLVELMKEKDAQRSSSGEPQQPVPPPAKPAP